MKALKIAGGVIVAVIIVITVLIAGIPSGIISSAVEARVARETGYHLTIGGRTRIRLWPSLGVVMNDVTLDDPDDHGMSRRVTIDSVQADTTLSSVWSGHPQIRALVVTRPVIHIPLLRERIPAATTASEPAKSNVEQPAFPAIDRIRVVDGTMVFSNPNDRVERRIEAIAADATIDAERKLTLGGTAQAGPHLLKFNVVSELPAPPLGRQSIPLDLRLEAPDVLHAPLTAKAELRLNGSVVMFNGVSGTLGDGAFSGWASVDAASKPLVKVDLDFQRLDLARADSQPASSSRPSSSKIWSNTPFDLTGLNYVDAQLRISAADAAIGQAHFAPVAIDATLTNGVLKANVANLGAYGGQANGELTVDVTSGSPTFAMHCDLSGVSALPLLTSLADFDKIDGKLQAKIAARSEGGSQQAIMSNLSGTVFADFRDGAIRGVNVAQMIRNLTTNPLSGWQEDKELTTDLSQLSASFRIDRGQATTTDLNLIGPLVKVTGSGTVDLPNKSLAFRVEPKLVMTTEGQGRTSDPVGFGIPVVIDGPWGEPRIYPDISGMLDDPDAAYARLREMGKGLFGPNALNGILGGLGSGQNGGSTGSGDGNDQGQGGLLGGNLGETLGNLIQQGLGARGRGISPNAQQPQVPQQGGGAQPQEQGKQQDNQQGGQQDSQPMNDVLRQLFNR